MKRFLRILLPLLCATLLLLSVRTLLLGVYRPAEAAGGGEKTHLVFVNLTAYGLRLPFEQQLGPCRWGYRRPAAGDEVAYRLFGSDRVSLGICHALPGDSISVDLKRRRLSSAKPSSPDSLFVVPAADRALAVTPLNARMLTVLKRRFERSHAKVSLRGRVFLDGQPLDSLRFSEDYYLLETQPQTFTLIPHSALVGKIAFEL
ncbi:MAG: hypothetical protein ACI3YC_02685 [Alloprevotella sp.]